jgi:AraC-like DNA-binding protein
MLAFLILFYALNTLAMEILVKGAWVKPERILPLFGPALLLLGPLLYLYILMITCDFRHSVGDIPHFLPAIGFAAMLVARVTFHHFVFAFLGIHLMAYLVLVFRRVIQFRRLLKENLSSPETADPGWLLWFCGVLVFLYAGLFAMFFLYLHTERGAYVPGIFSFLLTLTIALLGYRSLTQKALPLEAGIIARQSASRAPSRKPSEDFAPLRDALAAYMAENKPYRDPDLTLPSLAEETGINRNVLSRIINECEGMNFSDYVNSARLTHAKEALADPARRQQTILQIAFDAGFNSKTTFNTFFRRKEGITPNAFREKHGAERSGI